MGATAATAAVANQTVIRYGFGVALLRDAQIAVTLHPATKRINITRTGDMKIHSLWRGALAVASAAALTLFVANASSADDDIVVGFAHSASGWMEAYSEPPAAAAKIKIGDRLMRSTIRGVRSLSPWPRLIL